MGKGEFDSTIPESFLDAFVRRPGAFVVPTDEARTAAMEVVGRTYDAANIADKFGLYDDWKSVTESGFDPSLQLWELISFRNEPVLKHTADTMKELSLLLDSAAISGSDSESELASDEDMEDQGMSASDLEDSDAADMQSSDEEMAAVSGDDGEDEESESAVEQSASEDGDDIESESEGEGAEPSIIDDEFFSLAEMEKFADDAEEEDMRDRAILAGDYPKPAAEEENDEESDESEEDEDDIDLFQDFSEADDDEEGDDEENPDSMMYSDFFKAPKGSKRAAAKASREKHAKRVKFDPSVEIRDQDKSDEEEEEEKEEDEGEVGRTTNLFDDMSDNDEGTGEDSEGKSEFEKRQEKLQGLIAKLEDEAVEKKHWTMTGEVDSSARPKNSLLEEDVDFDHVQKAVPVITQEATQSLEDIIKRRILNEEWDD
ncbi:U3 snoRNP protein, partial [Linderina pennispora]